MVETKGKTIIGLVEHVTFLGKKGGHHKQLSCLARIDTGAKRTSLDISLAKSLGIHPDGTHTHIRSASGKTTRPLTEATVILKGKRFHVEINLIDRSHMKYQCIICRTILQQGFLIDPAKEN